MNGNIGSESSDSSDLLSDDTPVVKCTIVKGLNKLNALKKWGYNYRNDDDEGDEEEEAEEDEEKDDEEKDDDDDDDEKEEEEKKEEHNPS